jgi:uncharacterized protein (DUF736 family)
MSTSIKPGLYREITWLAYRGMDAINASYLADIAISPAHAKQIKEKGYTTKTMDFGTAVHSALLEPENFASDYVVYPGKTRRGKEWDNFKAENEGSEILKANELTEINELAAAVLKHPLAAPLLAEDGDSEVTIIWTEPTTGHLCKSRLDRLAQGLFLDLKTTRSISPFSFNRDFQTYKYDLKMAFYFDALAAIGMPVDRVKIIAAQSKPTIDVAVYNVPEEVLNFGRAKYQESLETLIYCRENDEWPGLLPYEEASISIPDWARKDAPVKEGFEFNEAV